MAQPTIKDLFTPINAIQTCMESQGKVVSDKLANLNNSIIGAATAFNDSTAAVKGSVDSVGKDVVRSLDKIYTVIRKSSDGSGRKRNSIDKLGKEVVAGFAGSLSAVVEAIGTGTDAMGTALSGIGELMTNIKDLVEEINGEINKSFIDEKKDALKENMMEKLKSTFSFGKKGGGEEEAKDIKVGKVEGAKDLGDSIKSLVAAVDAVNAVKGRKLKKFGKNMTLLIEGASEPLKKYRRNVKPGEGVAIAKDLTALGNSLESFVKDMTKAFAYAKLAAALAGKSPRLGALNKVVGSAVYAVMTNVYGARYVKASGTYVGARKKQAAMLSSAGFVLRRLGRSLVEFEKDMAVAAVFAPIALVGAALFRLTVPLIKSSVNALLGRMDIKGAELKYIKAGRILRKLGDAIMMFNAKMVLSTVMAPVAMVGMGMFALLMVETSTVFSFLNNPKTKASMRGGSRTLRRMGDSILGFEANLVLSLVLAPVAAIGLALSTPLVLGSYSLFSKVGKRSSARRVRDASLAIGLMGLSIISFSLSLLATTLITKAIITGKNGEIDPTNLVALAAVVPMFGLMLGGYYLFKKVGKPQSLKNSANGFLAITLMSAGLVVFSLGMLVSSKLTANLWRGADGKADALSIITSVAVFGMMLAGVYAFEFAGKNVAGVAKGLASVSMIALGIGLFGVGIGYYAESVKGIGMRELVAMPVMLAAFGLEFGVLGVAVEFIAAGSVAVGLMGVGMLSFGFGIAKFAEVSKGISFRDMGNMALQVGVFGVEFAGLGLISPMMALGSIAVTTMAPALALFGLGLEACVKAVGGEDERQLSAIRKNIGLTGIEFAGIGAVSPMVLLGSAAVGAMAPALALFGGGMLAYYKAVGDAKEQQLGMLRKHIGLMGLEFAGLGVLSAPIAMADAVVGLMAPALALFGAGNKSYLSSMENYKEPQLKAARKHIGLLGLEFAALGAGIVPILMGAKSAKEIGRGLQEIGKGLQEWKAAGDLDASDIEFLCYTVDTIKLVFQGKDGGDKGGGIGGFLKGAVRGLSGAIFAPFDLAAVQKTSTSLSIASGSIKSLARAMKEWEDSDISINSVDGLSKVMLTLNEVFGKLGKRSEKVDDNSILKKVIGISFSVSSPTDVELGIRSATGMGRALRSIAKGVIEFRDGIGKEFSDPTKAENLGKAIVNVITPLTEAFRILGDESEENNFNKTEREKGFFTRMFESMIGDVSSPAAKHKIRVGIDAVKGLGNELTQLAEGVKSFADLIPRNARESWLGRVGDNIGAVLSAISGPLAQLGTIDEQVSVSVRKSSVRIGNSMSEVYNSMDSVYGVAKRTSSAKDGVEAIRGLGETLKGVADATKTFSEIASSKLGKSGTWDENWNVTDSGSGALGAMTSVLCGQFALFSNLGKSLQESGTYEEVVQAAEKNWLGVEKKAAVSQKKSYIGLAIDSFANLGSVIGGIGDALATFNDTKWKTDAMTGAATAFRVCLAYLESFGTLGWAIVNEKDATALGSNGWDDVTRNKFGVIGKGVATIRTGAEAIIEGSENVGKVVEKFADVFKTIDANSAVMQKFYEHPEPLMVGMQNLMLAVAAMKDSGDTEQRSEEVGGRRPFRISIRPFSKTAVDSAVANSKTLKGVVSNIADAIKACEGIDPKTNTKGVGEFAKGISSTVDEVKKITVGKEIRKTTKSIKAMSGDLTDAMRGLKDVKAVDTKNVEKFVSSIAAMEKSLSGDGVLGLRALTSLTTSFNQNVGILGSAKMIVETGHTVKSTENLRTAMTNLSEGLSAVNGLKATASDSFTRLIRGINRSLDTLDRRGGKLKDANKLVTTLIIAKRDGVFNNIATSARSLTEAVNNLNNENLKPYSDMIVALSQLAQRDSRYKELFEDLINLLKEMNENLKEQVQGVTTGTNGVGESQPQTQPIPRVNLSGVESQLKSISTKLDGIKNKIPVSINGGGGGSVGE